MEERRKGKAKQGRGRRDAGDRNGRNGKEREKDRVVRLELDSVGASQRVKRQSRREGEGG